MRLTLAATLLCLLAPALAAQEVEQSPAEKIYFDPAIREADYDKHAWNLVKVIKADPDSVEALVALRRLLDLEEELARPSVIYTMLHGLSKNQFRDCGRWADEYVDAYVEFALKRSLVDPEGDRVGVAKRWRGLTEAAYIGPFADSGGSMHDDVLPPEVMLDFGAEYEGAWGTVAWQKFKHYDPLTASLDLYDQQRWSGYGYFVATQLISNVERDVRLHLDMSSAGKVWLNGSCVADYDSRRYEYPKVKTLDLQLVKGRNTLLVKISTISTLGIQVRGTDGQPIDDLVVMAPKKDDTAVRVRDRTTETDTRSPDNVEIMTMMEKSEHAAEQIVAQMMLRASFDHHGQRTLAGDHSPVLGGQAEGLPNYLFVLMEELRHLDKNPLLSSSDTRRRAREYINMLTGDVQRFIPAVFEQAKILTSDERFGDAIELLEGALEHTPQKWRVYLAMDKVFRDARWRMERERVIKLAVKQEEEAGVILPVCRAAARYYSDNGALAKEVEMDKWVINWLPDDPDAHMSLMHTYTRMGEIDAALEHARILVKGDPANEFLLGRLAELLAAQGSLKSALKVYETLAERSNQAERELFQAARVCLQLGDEESGTKYLRRVLELDPGQHLARRQLQLMEGESEDFWSEHTVGWDEIMEHDISAGDFPRADSALVLDELVQLLYADGSSVSYVHQVRKVLTQEGVDVRGREQISGELITARTVQADGTVLEPISQPGGVIEFPGVEIGAYLDIAYMLRDDGGPMETLDGDAFYFIDQNLAEPFAISRWVVLAPEDIDLNVVYHNLRPDDEGVTISEANVDGQVTYVWDVRNPRHPESETFMPSPIDFVPWIECVCPRDWKDRARRVADNGLRQVIQTDLIELKAMEIAEGDDDIQKAEAIYDWINENFTTEGDSWNAHQALVAMAGDREELFISMCAAAGLRMGFAQVDSPPPYKQDPVESLPRPHWGYPHREDFETEMVVIENSTGERAWIEMSDRMRPFGEISSRQFAAPAILWMDGDYELTHLPGGDREKDRFENRVHIQLKGDGSAKLDGSITICGERSFSLKEEFRTASYDRLCRELESSLAQHYPGFEANECRFPDIGDVGEPLVQGYKGNVRRLSEVNEKGMKVELPGEKLGRLLSVLVSEQERDHDLVIDFDLVQTDEIRISPPEGYAFADIPKDLLYPTAPLVYSLKFEFDEGDLVVKRKLVLGPGVFTPAEYPNLVEQVKQIKETESSTLKLKKLE